MCSKLTNNTILLKKNRKDKMLIFLKSATLKVFEEANIARTVNTAVVLIPLVQQAQW